MIKRLLVLLGIGLAATLASIGGANALGVGLDVGPNVPTVAPVPAVVGSVVSGAEAAVAGTGQTVNAPAADNQEFTGATDVPKDAVPVAGYKAFEDLVNGVQDGGGSHAAVVSGDAFSSQGVDGGVLGVPEFPAARLMN
jgi:hypothetical protein